jgi:hypothetical protein
MGDLRTSGLHQNQTVNNILPPTEIKKKEVETQESKPISNPEAFIEQTKKNTPLGTDEDLQDLRSSFIDSEPSSLIDKAQDLPQIVEKTELDTDEIPLVKNQEQPIKLSNDQLLIHSQNQSQPLEGRLQALNQLDTQTDPLLRENAFKVFRNQNKSEIQKLHAHTLGQVQHLQVEVQALKKVLNQIPECQSPLAKMNQIEQDLNKTLLELGLAAGRKEDITDLTAKLTKLQQALFVSQEELLVSLPPQARSGSKFALEKLIPLQSEMISLKIQAQRLDLLLKLPGFSASGLDFLSKDPLPNANLIEKAKENAFILELDNFKISSKNDISQLVSKIAEHKVWKLDNNEGFEQFFHQVLGSKSIKTMPHALRGNLLSELYNSGIGHPDLVVHFVMNNARNLSELPNRALLQRPEIKSNHIYQIAKKGVLNEAFSKLKAQQNGVELIKLLKAQNINCETLGNGLSQLDLKACTNLQEALLDKHVGPNILSSFQQRSDFVKTLKTAGLKTDILEGNNAEEKINQLFQLLVTKKTEGLAEKEPQLALLLKEITEHNLAPEIPPLSRLFFEIQEHAEKDNLLQTLKAPHDLNFSKLLDTQMQPDLTKIQLLSEALRLKKPEILQNQVGLKDIYDKLQDHPAQTLLLQSLKNIPITEHEIETKILERPEALALKAYETVLNAAIENPEFGRYESFHNTLKQASQKEGFNEGNNVKEFQNLQNRLSPAFFAKLDQIKGISSPQNQTEAANQLLQDLQLRRNESRIEAFFMDFILKDIADDRLNREETNKQFQELLSIERPLNSSDLRNISKLVGNNIEYYSQAMSLLNPKAPKTLSQIFSQVGMRSNEMGITRLGELKTSPDYQINTELQSLLQGLKKPSSESGKVHEFFEGITIQGGQPQNREWAINLELIRHSLAQIPKDDKVTRDQLTQRALSYLTRFASIPNPTVLGVQTTPLQKPLTDYHRANSNPLVKTYREQMAKHLGVNSANIQMVTDNRVMEVIKRDLRLSDHHQVVDAFDPNISSEDQGKLLKNLVKTATSGDDNSSFFIDISPLLARNFKGGSQDEAFVKDYIQITRQFVSDVVSSTAEEVALERYKKANPEDNRIESELRKTVLESPEYAKIKEDLDKRVVLGGTLNIGNQSVLYTAPLDTDFNSLEPVERPLNSSASTEFKNLVYHSGFTVGPQHMLENWVQLSDLDSIMSSLEISGNGVKFPDSSTKLEKISDWSDLLNHDTFKGFENLKTENKPYLQILPAATANLLKGLNDSNLQRTFESKGLGDLYQISANRILASMEQIVTHKDNFNQVLDHIQLIHEEIATLLTIAQPHKSSDFNQMMRSVTDLMPKDFNPNIEPEYYLKNSGMRGLATVFTGVEKLKGTGQLNIAVQNDTYYESAFVITGDKEHSTLGNRDHSLFSLDGDKVDETANTMKQELSGKKLDLYLCEFHHNISYSKTNYQMENLKEQVDKLFSEDMVSEQFTVAIDNTIAETNGQEFKDFLKHNEKRITDGKLNIVFYRSAQKFDMLGMDNYNGGIMSVINNKKDFNTFNNVMQESDGRSDTLSDINVQGFTHFEKYAQKELNQYRAGIMKAASSMANPNSGSPLAFPKEMYHAKDDDMLNPTALLKIAANTDPSVVFLDLSCPLYEVDSPAANDFLAQLQANLIRRNREKPEDFPLSNRASFGFPHSNISLIGGSKFRFNPGLESEDTLKNFQSHFVKLNELMLEAFQGAPESLRGGAVKLVITSAGDKLMNLRDQVKDLETKNLQVPVSTRLSLAETYRTCLNYAQAQNHLDKLSNQVLTTQEQEKLNEIKANLKADQLSLQISNLEKTKSPVPDLTRLEFAETKMLLKHTGDVRKQLELIDPTALNEQDVQRFHQLLNQLLPKN